MKQTGQRIKIFKGDAADVALIVNGYIEEFVADDERVEYISDYQEGTVTVEIKQYRRQSLRERLREEWYGAASTILIVGCIITLSVAILIAVGTLLK